MCFLVILGLLMGWVESPRRGLSDGAEARLEGEALRAPGSEESVGGEPGRCVASASSLSPLSGIPEMYLRPELIPVKSDGLPAVAEAERVVRSRR
ncbi:hypothetical protein LCGC14_1466550 [marine sediment metagenome]|uniref:Uncharacterized protein n=1 Tax=marine sediment metagenome TaxID=412755 RepID=A0A0F9IY17_9ZZZZ